MNSLGQQKATYAYDNAGSRTERVITLAAPSSQATALRQARSLYPDVIAETAIIIYPNPARDMLTAEITGYDEKMNIR